MDGLPMDASMGWPDWFGYERAKYNEIRPGARLSNVRREWANKISWAAIGTK
jgi:hypothetical protein